ncbi:hypothetical protein AURDEDRAFT_147300 [Auricularia subglabra TFB-10046 SS5]|uniref:BTB domain-containing protein n=1 Tax=Auricularia subglabra (strain TFB-10046 / SS5) TaxID=717982 RepID=J0LFG6_AURST|nr:hypothetical protein AURDEDRAFT_147300 [Auricularia subglabra TFB-10046 SS5]
MFTLPQPEGGEPIKLHNDADEFRDFLWYIHADPFNARDFFDAPSSEDKCLRLLGIANAAHMYDVEIPARRALELALAMLTARKRPFVLDVPIARRLLLVSAHQTDPQRRFCIDIICDAMYPRPVPGSQAQKGRLAVDPISVVQLARDTCHVDLLAHAYFYVLIKGDKYWENDSRLTAADRRRLLCGSHALHSPYSASRRSGAPWSGWPDANVHKDIVQYRSSLWTLFDDGRWTLTDGETAPSAAWGATNTQIPQTGAVARVGSDAQQAGDVFLEFLWEFSGVN